MYFKPLFHVSNRSSVGEALVSFVSDMKQSRVVMLKITFYVLLGLLILLSDISRVHVSDCENPQFPWRYFSIVSTVSAG
jgi:hypothetical protein